MTIIGQKNASQANGAKQRGAPSLALIAAGLFTLAAATLPVAYLIRRALQIDSELLRTVLFRAKTLEIFITTISLVLAVVALATLIGVSIAWALSNVDLPGLALLRALVILPVAIPSYVFTYSWLSLGFLPNGFLAAVVVLTLTTTPYVILAALAAFRRIDGAQLDVAQTLGLNQLESFFRVTFPQIRNAVGAGSLIVALYVLSD
ncbi:MAG: ABC transporter permease, partial [Actinomycetota bacterium]